MGNRTSLHGIKLIEQREGIRLKVYRDSKGLPTVGVGHLIVPADGLKVGQTITQEQCEAFLSKDLKECEDAVNAVGVPLKQWQFDALVSFIFNIGVGGFKGSTVRKRLKAKDYTGAGNAMLMWKKPPEIIGRRQTEVNQFLHPDHAYTSSAADPKPDSAQTATEVASPEISDTAIPTSTEQPPTSNVVVEKEQDVGFFGKIKVKLAGWFTTFGGLTGLQQYKEQIDAFGLPGWIIMYAIGAVFILFLGWLAYEAGHHLLDIWRKRKLTDALVRANATPTNSVIVACQEDLDKYEAMGYTVVRRQ